MAARAVAHHAVAGGGEDAADVAGSGFWSLVADAVRRPAGAPRARPTHE